MKPKLFIIDLDGTIADCRHRLHHITGRRRDYDMFYRGIPLDGKTRICDSIAEMVRDIKPERVLIVTGRPLRTLAETSVWIRNNFLNEQMVLQIDKDTEAKENDKLKEIWDGEGYLRLRSNYTDKTGVTLLMRGDNDKRKSEVVKRELLATSSVTLADYDVYAFEDDEKCRDMYLDLGAYVYAF